MNWYLVLVIGLTYFHLASGRGHRESSKYHRPAIQSPKVQRTTPTPWRIWNPFAASPGKRTQRPRPPTRSELEEAEMKRAREVIERINRDAIFQANKRKALAIKRQRYRDRIREFLRKLRSKARAVKKLRDLARNTREGIRKKYYKKPPLNRPYKNHKGNKLIKSQSRGHGLRSNSKYAESEPIRG